MNDLYEETLLDVQPGTDEEVCSRCSGASLCETCAILFGSYEAVLELAQEEWAPADEPTAEADEGKDTPPEESADEAG